MSGVPKTGVKHRTTRMLGALAGATMLVATATVGTDRVASADGRHGHDDDDDDEVTVVASGLDNPRGLEFARNGTLYVAESGRGGDGPCLTGPEGEVCFGESGAVTKVRRRSQSRVVTGLPSLAAPDGTNAIGPTDVSVGGWGWGRLSVTVGLGNDPAVRDEFPALEGTAQLVRASRHRGWWRNVFDVGDYEIAENPDGAQVDTNPNSVVAGPFTNVVADAGGNSLLKVWPWGRATTIAVFPRRMVDAPPSPDPPPDAQIPMDAVPTSVVRGPDGAFYVGELTGFPFPVGGARVHRVVPGEDPEVFATGFTNIIDVAFDRQGRLLVLEIAHNGMLSGDTTGGLLRVEHDGSVTELMTDGLESPGGLMVRRGAAYVSNCGTCAGDGTVLRIPLDP